MNMLRPRGNTAEIPIECRKLRSALVLRLVQAREDPAKHRVLACLKVLDDGRLCELGLTPDDIAVLRAR